MCDLRPRARPAWSLGAPHPHFHQACRASAGTAGAPCPGPWERVPRAGWLGQRKCVVSVLSRLFPSCPPAAPAWVPLGTKAPGVALHLASLQGHQSDGSGSPNGLLVITSLKALSPNSCFVRCYWLLGPQH